MPYRSDREALRERVEQLEREAEVTQARLEAREQEIRMLRRQLGRAEAKYRRTRLGRAMTGAGSGTFAGIACMLPVATATGGNAGLLGFGALVGGLFGLLMGIGSEIPPR